jgi:hypothetical protein
MLFCIKVDNIDGLQIGDRDKWRAAAARAKESMHDEDGEWTADTFGQFIE